MSDGRRSRPLERLDSEVSEVTSLLRNNVEKIIERGEKIDSLQDRSEDLEAGSVQFRKSATNIKKKMCWQNCRLMCIIGVIVFVVVAVIIIVIVVEVKPWENGSGQHHNHTVTYTTRIRFNPD
ncbi:vesicle-associated membrane protein 3-like [Gigantopelta aegis]|uniref:vesicle-associated membrane protein 3-like n=1 Tax=Gigantopelta aegis TaxID=1735272 RepID=UPI001B889134|nr:vesicle-associated membrane protein 3-like [Gigantopelta aegis]